MFGSTSFGKKDRQALRLLIILLVVVLGIFFLNSTGQVVQVSGQVQQCAADNPPSGCYPDNTCNNECEAGEICIQRCFIGQICYICAPEMCNDCFPASPNPSASFSSQTVINVDPHVGNISEIPACTDSFHIRIQPAGTAPFEWSLTGGNFPNNLLVEDFNVSVTNNNWIFDLIESSNWTYPDAVDVGVRGFDNCQNIYGEWSYVLNVTPPIPPPPGPPTCTLLPASQTISSGSATLNWTSQNATTGTLNSGGGIGISLSPVAEGSIQVSPQNSTTYVATFTGPEGSVDCTAQVNVVPVCTPNLSCPSGLSCSGTGCTTPANICGFAWGITDELPPDGGVGLDYPSTGVGWISFNSKDCDSDNNGVWGGPSTPTGCPAASVPFYPYGVNKNANNTLTGYAWSPNIGWIKFGGLSGFPTAKASGNSAVNAEIFGNVGAQAVRGWARACAGTVPGDCSNMSDRTDGWDGWISLMGTTASGGPNSSYGVKFDGQYFSNSSSASWSWGGPVVGWLDWDPPNTNNGVRMCDAQVAFDYTFGNHPNINNVAAGESVPTSGPVLVNLSSGTTQPVSLSISSLPDGLSASLSPTSCNPTCSPSPLLSVTADADAQPGNYAIGITGVSAGLPNKVTSVTINVTSAAFHDILNITCVPEPLNSDDIYVNRPMQWKVTVAKGGTTNPVPSFFYKATYNNEPPPTDFTEVDPGGPPNQPSYTFYIDKTYSTIGQKTVSVYVKDSHNPQYSHGTCTIGNATSPSTPATVIVDPLINEI